MIIFSMHILSAQQFSKNFISDLFEFAEDIETYPLKYANLLQGKILINAFFEASTRTSLSFECAMKQLGGDVITFNKEVSSLQKGESFEDTIRTLECYGDIMVLRHPIKNNIEIAKELLNIPLINGGNGSGEHPTQALLDLYTIYKRFKTLENKHILFIGDIKYSRTIHSLIQLFRLYPSTKIYLLPCGKHELIDNTEIVDENVNLSIFDVVYCTRYQKERVEEGIIDNYKEIIVNIDFIKKMKPQGIVMHPLPRNNEIDTSVDNCHKCVYFEQMRNGLQIRKALLLKSINL